VFEESQVRPAVLPSAPVRYPAEPFPGSGHTVMTTAIAIAAICWVAACAAPEQTHEQIERVQIDEVQIDNVWHQAKLRGVAFRAIGQEPGWLLEIKNGEEILLATDYGSTRFVMPYVEPVVYREERRTEFVLDGYETTVEIRGEPCTDSMSGEEFEVSVTVRQGERELRGCGRALF
jgi:uncharacterized membrane protein